MRGDINAQLQAVRIERILQDMRSESARNTLEMEEVKKMWYVITTKGTRIDFEYYDDYIEFLNENSDNGTIAWNGEYSAEE